MHCEMESVPAKTKMFSNEKQDIKFGVGFSSVSV